LRRIMLCHYSMKPVRISVLLSHKKRDAKISGIPFYSIATYSLQGSKHYCSFSVIAFDGQTLMHVSQPSHASAWKGSDLPSFIWKTPTGQLLTHSSQPSHFSASTIGITPTSVHLLDLINPTGSYFIISEKVTKNLPYFIRLLFFIQP